MLHKRHPHLTIIASGFTRELLNTSMGILLYEAKFGLKEHTPAFSKTNESSRANSLQYETLIKRRQQLIPFVKQMTSFQAVMNIL